MNAARSVQPVLRVVDEQDPLPPEDRVALQPRRSIDDLYRSQRSKLRKFFTRRVGDVDADDLVNEAFARYADRNCVASQVIAEPEAYLQTVATNLLRNRAKLAVRRAATYHEPFDEEQIAGLDPIPPLEDRDLLRRLDMAVQRLRPRTRQVFLLKRVEGLTYLEISDRMGMSVKGVKKQMAKALFELRRDVGPA